MNEGSSYNLAEIWQLPPMNGGSRGMVMGLRRPQFSDVNGAMNREVSDNDLMSLDQRGVHGGGGNGDGLRKRRDLEDDSWFFWVLCVWVWFSGLIYDLRFLIFLSSLCLSLIFWFDLWFTIYDFSEFDFLVFFVFDFLGLYDFF